MLAGQWRATELTLLLVLAAILQLAAGLWLPMPACLALLPTLREMGEERMPNAEGRPESPEEPGLRRSA